MKLRVLIQIFFLLMPYKLLALTCTDFLSTHKKSELSSKIIDAIAVFMALKGHMPEKDFDLVFKILSRRSEEGIQIDRVERDLSLRCNGKSIEDLIDLNSQDDSKAKKTLHDYPSLQARYDTFKAGLFGLSRPEAWALPSDFTE